MSHPPITPSPRPLALSSVVPLPFKPPQPPLIIDPSGFNALVKEHQHHQLQQQQQRVMTLSQQPNNPLPVRPLPYPSPSTDLPPPSTSSTPSTTPSLALSTGPLSLHWQGPPRPDFPSASPFQPLFPFGRQPTVQFTAQGSASMGGVSFSASSPAPHQLPPPTLRWHLRLLLLRLLLHQRRPLPCRGRWLHSPAVRRLCAAVPSVAPLHRHPVLRHVIRPSAAAVAHRPLRL